MITEPEFLEALGTARAAMLSDRSIDLKAVSPSQFEQITATALQNCLNSAVRYEPGSTSFPDIVCETFGVEVKVTQSDHWITLGNSIKESTRVPEVTTIFLFFLKKGGTPDIRFKKYHECVDEIVVTHSPRYRINMDVEPGSTIFRRMNMTYEQFHEDPITTARTFYANLAKGKPGDTLWWLDSSKEEAAPPIIRYISSLEPGERDELLAELIALFPEVLAPSGGRRKYESAALYCVAKHNLASKNFRDHFSAGGQVPISVGGKRCLVPKTWAECRRLTDRIANFIVGADAELLRDEWSVTDVPEGLARWTIWQEIARHRVGPHRCEDGSEISITDVIVGNLDATS